MKFYIDTLGCRLNEAESQKIAAKLECCGHAQVRRADEADFAILNTCGVTAQAVRKSRNLAHRYLKLDLPHVIMGCAHDLEPETFGQEKIPQLLIPNAEKHIADLKILAFISGLKIAGAQPSKNYRSHTRAFIKIQDGCNNACSYCAIRFARGREVSVPESEILHDIRERLYTGAKEIVLTGVQLGAWNENGNKIPELAQSILEHTDAPRIRFSSVEPWHVNENYLKIFENPRICRHLHIPFQHASDTVLRDMRRRSKIRDFERILRVFREEYTDFRISTDIIVGFPTETETLFAESLAFLEENQVDDFHAFTFSPRPGTDAALLKNLSSPAEIKDRMRRLEAKLSEIREKRMRQFVGHKDQVLWESRLRKVEGKEVIEGYTRNYLRVAIETNGTITRNTLSDVELTALDASRFSGCLCSAQPKNS